VAKYAETVCGFTQAIPVRGWSRLLSAAQIGVINVIKW
jgi:hypothetical protein